MKTITIFAALSLITLWFSPSLGHSNENLVIYKTEGEFDDVREDLVDAIIGRGLVIDYNGRPGEMLKRTQADVGGIDLYTSAEYLVFCSALLSRKTMETDIRNVGFCPYVITVYETVKKPGTVYVSYRKFNTLNDKSLLAVEKLLDGISREAAE